MAYVTPGTVAAGDVATAAAWNVLTNDVIFLGVPPAVKCTRSASAAYTNGATLAWPTEEYDTDSMHSTATNTSRITINTAGIYVISTAYFIEYAGTITFANPFVKKNGSDAMSTYYTPLNNTTNYRFAYSHIESCSIGDYLEVGVGFSGGSGFLQSFNAFNSYFAATWIGRTS